MKYIQIFKANFLTLLEYRVQIIVDTALTLVGVWLTFFLWQRITSDYRNLGSYDFYGIITYYVLTFLFYKINSGQAGKLMEKWVQDGTLSQLLVKPVKIFQYIFMQSSSSIILQVTAHILVTGVFITIFPKILDEFQITITNLVFLIIIIPLAYLFNFFVQSITSLIIFWTTTANGMRNLVYQAVRVLSGRWFPLDLTPYYLQQIFKFLPFQYLTYFEIKLVTSEVKISDGITGIIVLLTSNIIGILILYFMWNKALKNYTAVGA